jgi:hypothetical protein
VQHQSTLSFKDHKKTTNKLNIRAHPIQRSSRIQTSFSTKELKNYSKQRKKINEHAKKHSKRIFCSLVGAI